MTSIDYMKVLDIAALTLGSESHIQVKNVDINRLEAVIKSTGGEDIRLDVFLRDFSMEISLKKDSLEPKKIKKWLPSFEYQLEQNFFKNIVIENSENSREYRIKIDF
ncbi:MAG TPA: hypothetical protein PK358_01555 [Spirochaetota bacterium]|nr:hypothetical protein [Spirochaetota bacterium]HPJ33488.1 hypothetical protein [Spirochaetota bacterium]